MKFWQTFRIVLFVLCISAMIAGFVVLPTREFSENENRSLAQFPSFTVGNVLDCSFQDKLENYLSDQFPYRDNIMSTSTAILKASGRTNIGGAYIGEAGYDFEQILSSDINHKRIDKNVDSVRKFFESCREFIEPDKLCVMLVPTSGYVCKKYLPDNAPMFDQHSVIKGIENDLANYNVISIDEEMKIVADNDAYYKTDHHWTTNGAYVASEKWAYNTNRTLRDREYYNIELVADSFRGSLYSKVLDADSAYDSILKFEPVDEAYTYEVSINNGEKVLEGFYDESKLLEKDKYQYFFGGNYAEVHIKRVGEMLSEEQTNLLVIKDSFANAFVPFIAERFDNVYMLDLRFYRGDITTYLADKNISEVLILYNVSNFISDANIYKLGEHDVIAPEIVEVDYPDIEPEETPEVRNVNGVTIVGDAGFEGYTFESSLAEEYGKVITEQADRLDEIANVYCLVVPMACGITMPDSLQAGMGNTNMQYSMSYILNHMGSQVNKVNVYDNLMRHRNEYLYFRTDHHWTQLGAYYAYQEFCNVKGIHYNPLNSYKSAVYEPFLGSLYKKTEDPAMKANPDSLLALFPHSNTTFTAYPSEGSPFQWPVVNDVSRYDAGTKYSAFIAGDNPYNVIHNNDLENGTTCIVIKESYGNAFVPFLVDHYEYVYVIDYRYYTGSISDIARQHEGNCDIIYINNVGMITSKFLVAKLSEIK